jgi:hypothetical protein
MSKISLVGLASNIENEERALAYLEVDHNNNIYNWQIFIPKNVENIDNFLQSVETNILNDIDTKEAAWSALEPKTRTMNDPITGQSTEVPISKEEIVKPSIPDYYTLRRNEYPSLGDQLDAMWKGLDSPAFLAMQEKIASIKVKYPKPS